MIHSNSVQPVQGSYLMDMPHITSPVRLCGTKAGRVYNVDVWVHTCKMHIED